MEFVHYSVMLNECIEGLDIKKGGIYVDCTLGGAGHSSVIAEKLGGTGRLIAIDKDLDALAVSKERLKKYDNVTFVHSDYKKFKNILSDLGIEKVDGILIDLGVSSYQLDNRERGFSYIGDAELDMRMDRTQSLDAKVVVNTYSEERLAKIFFEYGEEKFSRKIAKNIVASRPINTTLELAKIIEKSIPASNRFKGGNPSKRVFQAIRIEVNEELDGLYEALLDMARSLNEDGRMCVITFHSLEDRIVKNVFQYLYTDCICPPHQPICTCDKKREVEILTKKPILPTKEELEYNKRSQSAKLRIVKKL